MSRRFDVSMGAANLAEAERGNNFGRPIGLSGSARGDTRSHLPSPFVFFGPGVIIPVLFTVVVTSSLLTS
jgi:hypothetical protein